ncbi:unnamed protein product [Clonostachys byssicola]|uniref:CHAT domain-containing protein n=1 Tax=Clonostachys byssicola TaxID=160290 RepID=A0A9N9XWI8_9HYPO|nr:unnamed protein product [Clonostachys byssicola]
MEDQALPQHSEEVDFLFVPISNHLMQLCENHFGKQLGFANITDLDAVIQRFQDVLDLEGNDFARAMDFCNLGCGYVNRFKISDEMADLEKSIENYQAAVKMTPPEASSRIPNVTNLAMAIYMRAWVVDRAAMMSRDATFVDDAVQLLEDLLAQNGSQYQLPFHLRAILADLYRMRWEQRPQENINDLSNSIQNFEQLWDLIPNVDSYRWNLLASLGRIYLRRSEDSGNIGDVDMSIKLLQESEQISTKEDTSDLERVDILHELGRAFGRRFMRLGGLGDAESSIHFKQAALNNLPGDSSPLERFHILSSLAWGYYDRYRVLESIEDLDISIRVNKRALQLVPERDDLQLEINRNLGDKYISRFERTGDLADIEQSISTFRKVLELDSNNEETIITVSQRLGDSLRKKYETSNGCNDSFEEAIQRLKNAISLSKDWDKRHRAMLFKTLANLYTARYTKTETWEDLETAISYGQTSVDVLPKGHPTLPECLFSLSLNYMKKAHRTKLEADHEIAIQTSQKAVDLTPNDHQEKCYRLLSLGHEYKLRFMRQFHILQEVSDMELAIEIYDQAFRHPHASIRHRIQAGRAYAGSLLMVKGFMEIHHGIDAAAHDGIKERTSGKLLTKIWDTTVAYQIAAETLSLLSQLTPLSLEVSDKQVLLREISRLPALIGVTSLTANKSPSEAIQYIELARGIIVGSLSNLRVGILDLETLHPELSQEFTELRDQLDAGPVSINGVTNPRHEASQKLKDTISSIRCLPGFGKFLLPLDEEELIEASARGPVVIINMYFTRSDALIIQNGETRSIDLPELYEYEVIEYSARPEIDRDTLEWLWDTAAGPILDSLGYLGAPTNNSWPRVFWIPTGALSFFPIHAAGYHYTGSTRTVIDRVISTYSSSVRALINGRRASWASAPQQPRKAVLVGVQELYHAPEEIKKLEKLCDEMHLDVIKPKPYREQVLALLAECEVFHFAGHGNTHPLDPSRSSLAMKDAPLAVKDLFNIKLHERAPFLAYLSACSTGRNEDQELQDEGLHLIGACQLAGFRNVIGTLRKVNDGICVTVAEMTYRWIRDFGSTDQSVAEGLHHATRFLRDQWMAGDNTDESSRRNGKSKGQVKDKQSRLLRSIDRTERLERGRDMVRCDEEPLYWAPFVYFGS